MQCNVSLQTVPWSLVRLGRVELLLADSTKRSHKHQHSFTIQAAAASIHLLYCRCSWTCCPCYLCGHAWSHQRILLLQSCWKCCLPNINISYMWKTTCYTSTAITDLQYRLLCELPVAIPRAESSKIHYHFGEVKLLLPRKFIAGFGCVQGQKF